MDNLTLFIKYHKHRESETCRVIQPFQHFLCQLHLFFSLRLAGIVVHMDIDKVLVDDITDGSIKTRFPTWIAWL